MALAQAETFLAHQVSLRSTGIRAKDNLVPRLWEGGSEKWYNSIGVNAPVHIVQMQGKRGNVRIPDGLGYPFWGWGLCLGRLD